MLESEENMNISTAYSERCLNFSKCEFDNFLQSFFDPTLDISRFSDLFLIQLFLHYKHRIWCVQSIMDEIYFLEGRRKYSMTKSVAVFKKKPLKGLSYKHFKNPHFISRNLMNYLSKERMRKIFEDAKNEAGTEFVDENFSSIISHKMTIDAYEEITKMKKLTGEWIVFFPYNEKNYYLTLAEHKECDHSIFQRIESRCFQQFTFIKDALSEYISRL